jgi:hypothetical protein
MKQVCFQPKLFFEPKTSLWEKLGSGTYIYIMRISHISSGISLRFFKMLIKSNEMADLFDLASSLYF